MNPENDLDRGRVVGTEGVKFALGMGWPVAAGCGAAPGKGGDMTFCLPGGDIAVCLAGGDMAFCLPGGDIA